MTFDPTCTHPSSDARPVSSRRRDGSFEVADFCEDCGTQTSGVRTDSLFMTPPTATSPTRFPDPWSHASDAEQERP